jgi:2-oxo-4-hydroxy-4-carboxy-5-ureidoimidazoline decarboxylase
MNMSHSIKLQELNELDAKGFVQLLGGVFEHSPWVAERVAQLRPFASVEKLHESMVAAIESSGQDTQLRLIRAHPELAGKAAVRGEMTDESNREQKGAGLDQCTAEEFASIQSLNAQYQDKFKHPFIVAVRGHTRQSVIALITLRLKNSAEEEQAECLRQIFKIGALRLADLVAND